MKETDRQMKETDRRLKELGIQIGGLGEKFGSFTEGMAFPSMEKLLRERFRMSVIAPNVRARKNGQHFEVDVLAYANTEVNAVYLVEVKSHLRAESIKQMLQLLRRFPEFFPEHQDKRLYGMVAAVEAKEEFKKRLLKEGIYLARIQEDLFELNVPGNFIPKSFS